MVDEIFLIDSHFFGQIILLTLLSYVTGAGGLLTTGAGKGVVTRPGQLSSGASSLPSAH